MLFGYDLKISNFRSIVGTLHFPFKNKITFVVGPNNTGKSNVLRLFALLFNGAYNEIDDLYDFRGRDKKTKVSVEVDVNYLLEKIGSAQHLRAILSRNLNQKITLKYDLSREGLTADAPDTSSMLSIIPMQYFQNNFLYDFGSSGSAEANVRSLIARLAIESTFTRTTYLPNVRFITKRGSEPPHFSRASVPGQTIAFGEVIQHFARMDRPPFGEAETLRRRLKTICDFMAFCLDKASVSIQVPVEQDTILVTVDGDERPLSSLGTGIEQLLMLGLAAIGFGQRLVLIDEPELHLHPRAQKRVLAYFNELDTQFIIATHSAACIDAIEADIVRLHNVGGEGVRGITVTSNAEKYDAVRDLGHSLSELIQTRYAIWVEGPTDRIYLNKWIHSIDEKLVEGVDYSILFYGGKVLSHHSFEDVEGDLVKAVTLCRAFAVIMDSDRTASRPHLNAIKLRIKDEVERQNGFCWITEGREIENYVSASIVEKLTSEFDGVSVALNKEDQVLDASKVKKTEFARRVVEFSVDEWPMDLLPMVKELVSRIRAAR